MSKLVVENEGQAEAKQKLTIAANSHLHFLNPLRSNDKNRSLSEKTSLFGKKGFLIDGLALTTELDAYHAIAGKNERPLGALQMLVSPEAVEKEDHLGAIELATIIIPVAILSEMLNSFFYEHSLFYQNNLAEAFNTLKDGIKDKQAKQVMSQIGFSILYGFYQFVRIPVIALAIMTAIIVWIPKMILGVLAATLVSLTRPIWYLPISVGKKDYAPLKQEENADLEAQHESEEDHSSHHSQDKEVEDDFEVVVEGDEASASKAAKPKVAGKEGDVSVSEDKKAKVAGKADGASVSEDKKAKVPAKADDESVSVDKKAKVPAKADDESVSVDKKAKVPAKADDASVSEDKKAKATAKAVDVSASADKTAKVAAKAGDVSASASKKTVAVEPEEDVSVEVLDEEALEKSASIAP